MCLIYYKGVISMYIGNLNARMSKPFALYQSVLTETLRDLHRTFGGLSFFLPASDSARAYGLASISVVSTFFLLALIGSRSETLRVRRD
jgi:hypothetical protein